MCATCGCATGTDHDHDHDHGPGHDHIHLGAPDAQTIAIEVAVFAKNDAFAATNRRRFAEQNLLALNLVSSPGSGKTTLLERTIREAGARLPIVVIEGDQATENDSLRIRSAGARALQINTGAGCHLDAEMIGRALDVLAPDRSTIVMIENVGNLVCPARFDLGEYAKVAILSVTEGDDKPAKYPQMFAAADLLVINKIDLLSFVDFDVEQCCAHARRVRPDIAVLALSARTGEGMDAWYAWLAAARASVIPPGVPAAH
jgi:hydrogenase nickel incorporation protein HypB